MSETSQLTTERPEPSIDPGPDPAIAAVGEAEVRQPGGPAAVGLALFAAVVLITVGIFQFIQGLAAVFQGEFYVVAPNYVYELNVSSWGWIHLVLGVVLAATGAFLLLGKTWARITAIVLAGLSAVANFLFIPYYPVWALLIIALDIAVIWALTSVGQQQI